MLSERCVDVAVLCWIEGHPGLATWLQAVFSVAAIVVAMTVPVILERRAIQRVQKRLHRRAEFAVAYADQMAWSFSQVVQRPSPIESANRVLTFPEQSMTAAIQRLSDIPLLEFEDQSLAGSLSVFQTLIENLGASRLAMLNLPDDEIVEEGWPVLIGSKFEHIRERSHDLRHRLRTGHPPPSGPLQSSFLRLRALIKRLPWPRRT